MAQENSIEGAINQIQDKQAKNELIKIDIQCKQIEMLIMEKNMQSMPNKISRLYLIMKKRRILKKY